MSMNENAGKSQAAEKGRKGLSAAELSTFCGQVALILEAGLPLYDGMETLAGTQAASGNADMYQSASRGVTDTRCYRILRGDEIVAEATSVWALVGVEDRKLRRVGEVPLHYCEDDPLELDLSARFRIPVDTQMNLIGERSGQLEKVMRGLEVYYAREDRIRSSVVSAVTYPLVLGVMLVIIVAILLLVVLPVFRRTLDSMGVADNALMNVGAAIGWVVMALIALVIIAVIVALALLRTKHRDKVIALAQRCVPSLGSLKRKLTASRVASVLSMMLSGGFQTGEALEMTAQVIDDPQAAQSVRGIREKLENGGTFADAVTEAGLFDDLHNRMIQMGSATGREDAVLGKLGDLYEEQVEDDISRLVSIIEPTLVALLSIVIGAVLLTVMLPMAGILSTL